MPPRILIIEDDAGTRHALRNLLQDESFVVTLAIDGRDGLDQHLSFKPDLILLDLHMPFMGGREFMVKLRAAERHPTPVLIMTSDLNERTVGGAQGLIRKPFEFRELLRQIGATLQPAG